MKGVEQLAFEWCENAVAQLYWNLSRRGVPDDQCKTVCAGTFEAQECNKIGRFFCGFSRVI